MNGYTPEVLAQFVKALTGIRDHVNQSTTVQEEVAHLRKVITTNRLFFLIGYIACLFGVNLLSMFCLAIYLSMSWTIVMHHISHGGFNGPQYPSHLQSRVFAIGWRRWVNWMDWMYPAAWHREHNILHHMYVNETKDPDQISYWQSSQLPPLLKWRWLAWIYFFLSACFWRVGYYPYSTYKWYLSAKSDARPVGRMRFWFLMLKDCYLPNLLLHYGLLALPFLAFGQEAVFFYLINRLGAELISGIHTFVIIGPNHTGDDLLLMDTHYSNRGQFYLNQILSSCNFKTGGYWRDYFHGYLNYQIEHHLFPNLSPLKYVRMQPAVKQLCSEFGIPYVQEPVGRRLAKFFGIFSRYDRMTASSAEERR